MVSSTNNQQEDKILSFALAFYLLHPILRSTARSFNSKIGDAPMASAVEKARQMDQTQAKELVDILTSKMALRKAFGLAGVDRKTLERIQTKVSDYEQEIAAQEEAEQEKKLNVEKNRDEAMDILKQMGLSPEDLISKSRKKSSGTSSVRPRAIYQIETPEGETKEIEAAVAGRTPKLLAEYMERSGKSREECMVRRLDQ